MLSLFCVGRSVYSPERDEGKDMARMQTDTLADNALLFLQMESAVTAPVSGHIKRVAVQEGRCRGRIALVTLFHYELYSDKRCFLFSFAPFQVIPSRKVT